MSLGLGANRLLLVALLAAAGGAAWGQNVVSEDGQNTTLAAIQVSMADVDTVCRRAPDYSKTAPNTDARRMAGKLEAQVAEFIAGWPWKPFHHTLGISGHETLFGHPDEMFYSLAVALPQLSKPVASQTREFLRAQLASGNLPFAAEGFDPAKGREREAYAVPGDLRQQSWAKAKSAFGLYAFWAYCHYGDDAAAGSAYWPQAKTAGLAFLQRDYRFEVAKRDYADDEAEQLNGHLAGLIGLARLARMNEDQEIERQARERALQLLELRVNLERVNSRILERTKSASKHLHNFKLARYCGLTPEIAEALRRHAPGCAEGRLKTFRLERNGWHMAFGDRLVGGENYTNPAHFSRALFAGAAMLEDLPADNLCDFVDIPWCKGDFYFMEKCVLAIWAANGRPWESGP